MTQSSAPVRPSAPEGFKLAIPEQFRDCFLIPIVPLGTWDAEKNGGSWVDKAPSANGWQKRSNGYKIAASATAYGIPAGKNNLLFVDIDTHKEDENGFENLRALVDEYGDGQWFDTYAFRTGSGAQQLVFRISSELQAELKPSKGSTLPGVTLGVDIRVNNSYSVGPGSLATQPDGSVGSYEELTPGMRLADIDTYPWFVELLRSRAAGTSKNPTLLARKNAAAMPSAPLCPPRLTSQKGAGAIAPLIESLMNEVADTGKRHPALFKVGTRAGARGVAEEQFVAETMTAIEADAATEGSRWSGYDMAKAETQLRTGWAKGAERVQAKQDLDEAYSFYTLAHRFVATHPEYRWVVPKEDARERAGAWLKFENNPKARDYGIYGPMDASVIAVELADWLTDDIKAAEEAGEHERASRARKTREGATVDKIISHMKGMPEVRAFLEDFDTHPSRMVDMAGIRDLDTMAILPITPAFLSTEKLYFAATAANWEQHKETVERIMSSCHPEDRPFLDAMLGTILRRQQPLSKKGVILYGPSKDNGKTTLVEVILAVLGAGESKPLGLKASHSIAHRNSDNKYAEADLDGKTLTILDDFAANREVDAEKLKQYIGSGQGFKARQIGERTRTIRLFHTFLLTCNRLPNFGRGEDVMDRFEIVRFLYKYPSDDQYDATNPWHRKRDPFFTAEVGRNRDIQDAMYYYLLLQHKAWADSDSRVETDTISDGIRASKADWKGKTNTLHAALMEFAVPDPTRFVTEKDLIGFISHTLREQGQGVFGTQALRTELEALHLFREWNVEMVSKKPRSRSPKLRDLIQSRWLNPETNRAERAADAANIFVGLRLKTNDHGSLMDEDTWAEVQAGGEKIAEALDADATEDFEATDHDPTDFSF